MIAALAPCSFIDFPGRLAAVLFTQGCDLRCRYCHNPSLCPPGRPATPLGIDAFLAKRRGFLDGVVVTGGEPTLWRELPELLAAIRRLGFAVKLDSNGMHPAQVDAILADGLVDFLAVDVKAHPGASSRHLCGHARQAELALATLACAVARNVPHEARTTVVAGIHDPPAFDWIVEHLGQVGCRRWFMQPVRGGRVLDESFPFALPEATIVQAALAHAETIGLEVGLGQGWPLS